MRTQYGSCPQCQQPGRIAYLHTGGETRPSGDLTREATHFEFNAVLWYFVQALSFCAPPLLTLLALDWPPAAAWFFGFGVGTAVNALILVLAKCANRTIIVRS